MNIEAIRAEVLRLVETRLQGLIELIDELIPIAHLITNDNLRPHLRDLISAITELQDTASWRTTDPIKHFLENHPKRSLQRVYHRLVRREFYLADSLTIKNWRTLLQTQFELIAIQSMVTRVYIYLECQTTTTARTLTPIPTSTLTS